MADKLVQIRENIMHERFPRSIKLKEHVDQNSGPGKANITTEQTYIETKAGERYFDEYAVIEPDGKIHKTYYSDGSKAATIRYKAEDQDQQAAILIARTWPYEDKVGYRSEPRPFQFYHVGLIPLQEALAAAEPLADGEVIGRPCDRFHFKGVGSSGQSLVYSLDRETGVPLKVVAYANVERLGDDRPNWVWEATTLDSVGPNYHFPLHSTFATFSIPKNGRKDDAPKQGLSQKIEVKEIVYDAHYPKSTFWPVFQPGVVVDDTVAKKKFQVPRSTTTVRQEAPSAPPIRNVENNSIATWSLAGVVLSIAVLFAAVVLMRRR